MNTMTPKPTAAKESTLFRANPVLSRLSRIQDRAETNAATYSGIAVKTSFFLVMTLLGIVLQQVLAASLGGQGGEFSFTVYEKFSVAMTRSEAVALLAAVLVGFVAELLGIFVRKTVPVTGTIYSVCQGYVISFLVFKVLKGYEYLGLEALLLTAVVVAVMSWLYSSGTIKADKKFRTVLLTLVLGSVGLGVISFVGSLIPALRPYVQAMTQNPVLSIGLDIIGLLTAALFLISDFSMIDSCVQEGYPKEYEWSAAFGLVFTVLWIYMKILDLLIQINGKKKD